MAYVTHSPECLVHSLSAIYNLLQFLPLAFSFFCSLPVYIILFRPQLSHPSSSSSLLSTSLLPSIHHEVLVRSHRCRPGRSGRCLPCCCQGSHCRRPRGLCGPGKGEEAEWHRPRLRCREAVHQHVGQVQMGGAYRHRSARPMPWPERLCQPVRHHYIPRRLASCH